MSLYLDLQPAPQFDESLVTYCVVNFQRIKETLNRANTRVTFDNFILFGPWPKSQSFNVPYRANLHIWSEGTFFLPSPPYAPSFIGLYIDFDGGPMYLSMDQFFNETNSHKACSVVNEMVNIPPGNHYVTVRPGQAAVASDTMDRCRLAITYYEVN